MTCEFHIFFVWGRVYLKGDKIYVKKSGWKGRTVRKTRQGEMGKRDRYGVNLRCGNVGWGFSK